MLTCNVAKNGKFFNRGHDLNKVGARLLKCFGQKEIVWGGWAMEYLISNVSKKMNAKLIQISIDDSVLSCEVCYKSKEFNYRMSQLPAQNRKSIYLVLRLCVG